MHAQAKKLPVGPEQRSENASGQSPAPEKPLHSKEKLLALIKLVTDTAGAKGWRSDLVAKDEKNHRHATVSFFELHLAHIKKSRELLKY